jgi:CubicO group peptidase (beta-lactamase class C family)
MKKCFWLLLILIRSTATLNAQQVTASPQSTADKLDEYLTAASRQHRFNGTALVARKGKILLQKGYGWNNVSAKIPNDTNSIYQLGSITKPFTGAAILLLQDEGKLSVTDKLSKYLPVIPGRIRLAWSSYSSIHRAFTILKTCCTVPTAPNAPA